MKRILLLTSFLVFTFMCGNLSAQSVSATFSGAAVPASFGTYDPTCSGDAAYEMTLSLPTGSWLVTGVDVVYDMTAGNGAWMGEQRSQLACIETGMDEGGFASGSGSAAGTFPYSRSGLAIANGIQTGDLTFEMQLFRTWGGSTCETSYQNIPDGTWTVTVNYTSPPACTLPTVTYDASACTPASTFSAEIDVTDLGSGAPYTLSDDQGTATMVVNAIGPITYGSYPAGTSVTVTISSDADPTGCTTSNAAPITVAACPPPNDFCSGAIPITPSAEGTGCGANTFAIPFSTDATSDSGVPTVCSDPGLDQWFTWTATTNALRFWSGSPGNPGIAVFANCADANAGTDISCSGTFNTNFVLSGWSVGDDLLIQVYDFGGSVSDIAFCLEEFAQCDITSVVADTPGACNTADNTYDVDITVTYMAAPTTGTLNINGEPFAITSSPQTETLTLPADGAVVDVTAVFSDDTPCTATQTAAFTAPAACATMCIVNTVTAGTQTGCVWDGANAYYTQEVTVTSVLTPVSGNLSVNGQLFPVAASPQTVTLVNLTSDGMPVDVTAFFDAEVTCTKTETGLFTAPGYCGPPVNDDCVNAIALQSCVTGVTGTSLQATLDAEYTNCGAAASSSSATEQGVWYSYAGDDNEVTITTCDPAGGGYDSRLTVYSGTCGALVCITGNDDMTPACTTGSFRSEVTFNANAGTDYLVFVHGYQNGTGLSAQGNFTLDITCNPLCSPIPTNDDCATATALIVNIDENCTSSETGNNSCATNPLTNPTACYSQFATLPDVWYSFIATSESHAIVMTQTAPVSVGYAIYDGCGNAVITCNGAPTSGTANALNGLTIGTTYYVQALSTAVDAGEFSVCITTPPPANNDCADAIDISNTTVFTSTTLNATPSTEIAGCATNPDDDVWFSVTSDGMGTDLEITVTGGVEYELFSGGCGLLTSLGCNASPYTIPEPSATYLIRCYDPAVGFGGGSASRAISSFTIQAGGAALPIELTSFTGYADDAINVLEFEVATQENVAMFYIERSKDGMSNFEAIAETAAAGTTDELMSYRMIDEAPLTMGYYRMVSKDFDGQMQTSNVIAIERPSDKFTVASVYPVPTNNSVFVDFNNNQDGDVQIVITDVAGKRVLTTQIAAINGKNKTEVNIASLSSGIYFMSLSNSESVIVERIIKN